MIQAGALVHPYETLQILFSFKNNTKRSKQNTVVIPHFLLCWWMRPLSRAARSLFVQHVGMPGTKPPVKQIIASRATQENNALNGVLLPRLALDDAAKAPGW